MFNYKEQKEAFRKLPGSKRKQVLGIYGDFKAAFDSGLVVYGKRAIIASPLVIESCATPSECFDMLDAFGR